MAAPDNTGFVLPENQQPVGPWPDDILGRNYDMSGGSFGPFPNLPPAAPSTQQFWNQTLLQAPMSPGTGVRVPEYPALIPPTVAQEPEFPGIQGTHGKSLDKGMVSPPPPGNFSPTPLYPTKADLPWLQKPQMSYTSNQTDYNTLLQRLLQYQQIQNQQQQAAPSIAPSTLDSSAQVAIANPPPAPSAPAQMSRSMS